MKKVLSILLTAAMLLTLFTILPMSAHAVETIGDFQYTYIYDENGYQSIRITKYTGTDAAPVIPTSIDGVPVTEIGSNAFKGNTYVTTIVIPSLVDTIGTEAFRDCTNLTKVTFPNTLELIDSVAFAYCYSLANISVPDSLKQMGADVFLDTKWINNQPNGLVYLGKVAYMYKGTCPATVTLRNDTIGIAGAAFAECTQLSNISLPVSVRFIGYMAFIGCTALKSLTVPKTVTRIGDYSIGWSWDGSFTPMNGVTINGYAGSAAEEYANLYGVNFNTLTETLATPKVTKLENITSGVRLTIAPVNGAKRYRFFVRGSKNWVKLGDSTSTTFVHKAAKSGTKYLYTVRVVSANGKTFLSDFNHSGWAKTFVAAPLPPTLKNVKAGIRANWNYCKGAAKYRLFRKVGNGKWVAIATTTNRSFVDKKVKKGVTYRYTVRCLNKKNQFISAYYTAGRTIKRNQ